jgi:hypothetical protein
MKNARLLLSISVAAAALWYTGAAIAAEHEHKVKVGKTGEVSFTTETKVGDLTLKPGRYKFDHRVSGADHFVHFTEWSKQYEHGPIVDVTSPIAHPGEVKCRVEMLTKTISDTTIYTTAEGKAARVTRVEVAGENVAHLF